jgi:membrane fusion protein, heavy metal efflux system
MTESVLSKLSFSQYLKPLAAIAIATVVLGGAILAIDPPAPKDEHGHDHGGHDHGDEHDHGVGVASHVAITPEAAKAAGVEVVTAGPAKIAQVAMTMGSIVLDPAGHARVNARFPGVIREMRKNVGDAVGAGEVLASVESNESLQAYQVKSPVDGAVIARNKNVGEISGTDPVYEIANLARVYAELHVFPRDLGRVAKGQRVRLSTADGAVTGEGVIGAVLPVAEASSQSVLARVQVDNAVGQWRPGSAVRGQIVVSESDVAVAVRATAIQEIEGKPVVFVQSGEEFEVRPVLLGQGDGLWVEVQEGLYDGDVYAATNSFLFKADLGKATAEHEH